MDEIIAVDKANPKDTWLLYVLQKQNMKDLRVYLKARTGSAYSTATKASCANAAYDLIRADR